MPARKLILIEGMIGAGKSTTAGRLGARLTEEGHDVRVFHEFADDHPIRTRLADILQGVSASPDGVYHADQWNALADRCVRGPHVVILESAFLQNSAMPHFFHHDRACRSADLVRAVDARVPLAVRSLLTTTLVALALAAAIQRRNLFGPRWAPTSLGWPLLGWALAIGVPSAIWLHSRSAKGLPEASS
jgi:hypothetical protein